MKYMFFDDYSEGVHPLILKYITENNDSQLRGYGRDEPSKMAAEGVKKAFGVDDADVHFLPTGMASNIVGIKPMLKSFESVIAPDTGHVYADEAGAIEAAGHKVIPAKTPDGKITPELIEEILQANQHEHTTTPRVVYISQETDLGTVYSKSELTELIKYAKNNNLLTFLDGARLAMALVSDKFDIEMSEFGSLGLDIFYLGGTKNGGMFGEAVVVQNDDFKEDFRKHMKQRGVLVAKGRFMSQQFARFFNEDNLWLNLAKDANASASRMHKGLRSLGVEFENEPEANMLFPTLSDKAVEKLEKDWGFYRWKRASKNSTQIRLVCSWATKQEMIDQFIEDTQKALAA